MLTSEWLTAPREDLSRRLVVDSDFSDPLCLFTQTILTVALSLCAWPQWGWPLRAPACWRCGRWGLRWSEASAETDRPLPEWGSGTPRVARAALDYKHSYMLIRHTSIYTFYSWRTSYHHFLLIVSYLFIPDSWHDVVQLAKRRLATQAYHTSYWL